MIEYTHYTVRKGVIILFKGNGNAVGEISIDAMLNLTPGYKYVGTI